MYEGLLGFSEIQPFGHLIVQDPRRGEAGPITVDDKLWDGPLSREQKAASLR